MERNRIEKTRTMAALFLCLAIGTAPIALAQRAASAESNGEEPADVVALRAEVRRLGLEVLRFRAELMQWKIESIGAQLEQARAQRQWLAGERQVMEREIGELSQGLSNAPGASEEERREELKTVQLPALVTSERAAGEREASLAAALGAETARLNEIRKQAERRAGRTPAR